MNLIKEDVEKFRRVANMLQQLPEDSDLLKLLYKDRTELSAGVSIMMAVGRLANESSVVIQLYIVTAMSSSEGTKKYLAHTHSSQSVQLDKDVRSSEMLQNEAQYKNVREAIVSNLGTRASALITELVLDDPKIRENGREGQPKCEQQ